MDRKSQQFGGVLLLSIGLVSGCASGNTTSDDISSDAVVEMIVLNRTPTAVTVFAWWLEGPRVRLGELSGGANRTFTTPIRGQAVSPSLDVLSGVRRGRSDSPRGRMVPVQPYDRIEWEIRSTSNVVYRRLPGRARQPTSQ
jgi:hypothetical protein